MMAWSEENEGGRDEKKNSTNVTINPLKNFIVLPYRVFPEESKKKTFVIDVSLML